MEGDDDAHWDAHNQNSGRDSSSDVDRLFVALVRLGRCRYYYHFVSAKHNEGVVSVSRLPLISHAARIRDCDRGVLDFRLQCVCFWRFLGDFYSDYQCVRGPKRDCDDCRFGNAFYDGAQLQLVLD